MTEQELYDWVVASVYNWPWFKITVIALLAWIALVVTDVALR